MPDTSGTAEVLASSRMPAAAALALSFSVIWLDSDFGGPVASGFVFALAVVGVVLAAIPRRIACGPEGLRVAWVWRPRFVRYSQIKSARPEREAVQLTLDDGSSLTLRRSPFGGESPKTVLERLWTTVTAGAEAGARPNERAALARGERRPRAWVESLRALTPHGTQYRQSLGLDLPRLWSITENPAIESELRGAAAIALAATLDEAGRKRLQDLAATAVEPRLRSTFERVTVADHAPDLEAIAVDLMLSK